MHLFRFQQVDKTKTNKKSENQPNHTKRWKNMTKETWHHESDVRHDWTWLGVFWLERMTSDFENLEKFELQKRYQPRWVLLRLMHVWYLLQYYKKYLQRHLWIVPNRHHMKYEGLKRWIVKQNPKKLKK